MSNNTEQQYNQIAHQQHHDQQQEIVQENDRGGEDDENNEEEEREEHEQEQEMAVEEKEEGRQGEMVMEGERERERGNVNYRHTEIERLGYEEEQQHQRQQQQQQQNYAVVRQQQPQEEEGELHDSNPSVSPQQQQQPSHLNNTDSYINKLQTHLSKVRSELIIKTQQYDSLLQQTKKTKQTLKKLRFDFLSSKQQLSALNQHKTELQKRNESLMATNTHLQEQLQVFRQAGDVNYYKSKIIQLQKLLQVQNKQLSMRSVMVDEKDELGLGRSRVDVLALLDKYERENVVLNSKHAAIMSINAELQDVNTANQLIITELKLTISQNAQTLALEKQHSLLLQEDLKSKQQDFQKKIKQLQESLQQIMVSQENKNHGCQMVDSLSEKKIAKSPEELYGIKILAPLQERNLIMREYIQLEIKHQALTQELANLRERHYNTLREVKNISATHVPKKDFSELYKKYVKLRKCLENSLISEQNLRKELLKFSGEGLPQESNPNGQSKGQAESQAFSKYKTLVLEQPQNQINKIDKIIQKTNESQKQLFTLKQQLETKQKLIRNQKLLKQKDEKIVYLEKQCQKSKKMIQLYDTELTYKNNEIQMLRRAHHLGIQKIFQLQKNLITKEQHHQLKALIEQKQMTNEILQIKNIQALRENAILKTQKRNLTQLYNDLKSMYEEIINKEPQLQLQQNKTQQQKQGSMMEIQQKPCKQCLQRQQKQKSLTFSQVQTQTQGLSQIYYKQIKQLLTILRKFPKKVDSITSLLQGEKTTIHEVKKRYDQVMQAYGAKYRQLDEEKKANDQWRLKQKDEIREEFQQIRELLLNQRLITALRKAKSLIEFYEQNAPQAQGDENPQDGVEYEQVNQKPKQNGEQPIEEQKQNL